MTVEGEGSTWNTIKSKVEGDLRKAGLENAKDYGAVVGLVAVSVKAFTHSSWAIKPFGLVFLVAAYHLLVPIWLDTVVIETLALIG